MLVTVTSGARLVLAVPVLVLVLAPLVSASHQSPAEHHSGSIVRLLNTPVHQLDDAAIWEVASFLSNYTSLPQEGNSASDCTGSTDFCQLVHYNNNLT